LAEAISGHLQPELPATSRLTVLLHDAAEYVLGDVISPFKTVIGEVYKTVEARLTSAIYLRFGLPAEPPASLKRLIKRSDRIAAFQEATRLAGFAREEALKFFGRPNPIPDTIDEHLSPWPIETAQARYLARFDVLMEDAHMTRGMHETEPQPVHAQIDLSGLKLDSQLRSKILLLRRAIKDLKQVIGVGDGLPREFCPYTLGVGAKGDWRVFAWQFGGTSSQGLNPGGDWRCLTLDELEGLKLRDGEWHHGAYTGQHARNSCIHRIDSDVAIKPKLRGSAAA